MAWGVSRKKIADAVTKFLVETAQETGAETVVDLVRGVVAKKTGAQLGQVQTGQAPGKPASESLVRSAAKVAASWLVWKISERRDDLERFFEEVEEQAFQLPPDGLGDRLAFTGNIRRHFREAARGERWFTEEKLTSLMIKLLLTVKDKEIAPREDATDTCKHLNFLSDAEFDERMYLVENDGIQQAVGQVCNAATRGIRALREGLAKRGVR